MCRGADHAIVKRKTQSIFGGKMCVNDLGIGGICLAKRCKQSLCLRSKIVACSHGDQRSARKCVGLFVKAQHAAFFGCLLGTQKCQHVRITTVQQH